MNNGQVDEGVPFQSRPSRQCLGFGRPGQKMKVSWLQPQFQAAVTKVCGFFRITTLVGYGGEGVNHAKHPLSLSHCKSFMWLMLHAPFGALAGRERP